MREIKFRAWDRDEKEMLYEGLAVGLTGWIFYPQYQEAEYCFILMQYTGLKDKNNKEIYEGDILRVEEFGKERIVEVWFNDYGSFLYGIKENEEGDIFHPEMEVEVIGNVWENKDLLNNK